MSTELVGTEGGRSGPLKIDRSTAGGEDSLFMLTTTVMGPLQVSAEIASVINDLDTQAEAPKRQRKGESSHHVFTEWCLILCIQAFSVYKVVTGKKRGSCILERECETLRM